jgi:hypothetical protein
MLRFCALPFACFAGLWRKDYDKLENKKKKSFGHFIPKKIIMPLIYNIEYLNLYEYPFFLSYRIKIPSRLKGLKVYYWNNLF